jgi:imidazolonepropionase-like amidohydrolase
MPLARRFRSVPLLALLASAPLAACGDDTTDGSSTSSTSSTSSSNGGGGEGGATTSSSGGGGSGAEGGQGGAGGAGGGGGSEPYVPPTYGEIDCPGTIPAASTGTCEVGTAGTSGFVLRGTVLGPDRLYRDGSVFVDSSGVIQCVGCDCATTPGYASASIVNCGEGVISPGLINPHDHITFANNPPIPVGTTRYDHRHEWRIGAGPTKPAIDYNGGAQANVVRGAELRFVMSGATSAASAGGQAGMLRNVDSASQLQGLAAQAADSDTFPLGDANGTRRTNDCNYGSNRTTASDIAGLDGYLPHISEGINLEARNEFVCTSSTNAQVSGANDVVAPQTAIVHAVGMRPEDFVKVRDDYAAVVWSPRSNVSLYGNTAPVTLIDRMAIPIALGTDWMPSGSMNILRELRCADELNQEYFGLHFSDLELWRMVTENAAMATGTSHVIGSLRPGYVADIAVFDASQRTDFRAVIGAGVEDVALVLRGGLVLYGDAAVVASSTFGGGTCETLDVCGTQKRACVQRETGQPLATVRSAVEAFYPLFYCNDTTPTDEPSCVPYRATYQDGITATDGDGDGIPDATDLCPEIFDPIRPMDGGAQGDADGDDIGDACDPCPLDQGIVCEITRVAADVDGDGVLNAVDDCPEPGARQCPVTPIPIATIRNPNAPGHPAEGTTVAIVGHVTGIAGNGFSVQDSSNPWSGIFVFTNSAPTGVAIGNEVQVVGTYDEFFDYSEITGPTTTVLDAGTTLPYTPIDVANPSTLTTAATAEPYESMLVRVSTVAITTQNADGAQDFDEFVVTGGLRVNDGFHAPIDNQCAVGSTFTSITGLLAYSFSNYKLEPRGAADFVGASCNPIP